MIVYAVVDDALSPDFSLGVELEVFVLVKRQNGHEHGQGIYRTACP